MNVSWDTPYPASTTRCKGERVTNRRDFDAAKKRDLVRAAASDLPTVITANYDGTCTSCGAGFVKGSSIRRDHGGWMHAGCVIRTVDSDIVNRMQARRERLRAQRSDAL